MASTEAAAMILCVDLKFILSPGESTISRTTGQPCASALLDVMSA